MRFSPALILFVIGLLLYLPMFSAGFAGDDEAHFYIVQHNFASNALWPFNAVVGSPADNHLLGYFYRPLPFVIYSVIYQSLGLQPVYFHVVQFCLYMLAVYLFFLFCRRFFPQRLSFLLTTIFLIHPANNELAAYIAALDETLCLLFGMLSLLLIQKKHSLLRLSALAMTLLLTLFSKETGILFVILCGLFAWYNNASKRYLFPMLLAVACYLSFRVHASANPVFILVASHTEQLSLAQHLLLAPQIAFAFLREIVMPTRAAIKQGAFNLTLLNSLIPTTVIILFTTACFIFWKFVKKRGNAHAKMLLFFFSWIVLGIVLHLHIIPLEVTFAERWLYITEIGILGVFGVILTILPKINNKWIRLCGILFIILLCFFALETVILNTMWHDWERYFDN